MTTEDDARETVDWHQRWEEGRIGFHRGAVHERLAEAEAFASGDRVLVPLAGKSLDLWWLAEQGVEVVGVELVELAVEQFFADSHVTPEVDGNVYKGEGVTMLVGNILEVDLGEPFDGIWDRAALIAIEPEDRKAYAQKLTSALKPSKEQLLVTLSYDQSFLNGPPWSLEEPDVLALYEDTHEVELIAESLIEDPPKRMAEMKLAVREHFFRLKKLG